MTSRYGILGETDTGNEKYVRLHEYESVGFENCKSFTKEHWPNYISRTQQNRSLKITGSIQKIIRLCNSFIFYSTSFGRKQNLVPAARV